MPTPADDRDETARSWSLLSPQLRALLVLYRDPDVTQQRLGVEANLSPAFTRQVLADLEGGGYMTSRKVGRNRRYDLQLDEAFGEKLTLGELLAFVQEGLGSDAQRYLSGG